MSRYFSNCWVFLLFIYLFFSGNLKWMSKPFKNGVSVPYSSLGLLDISLVVFQSQSFGGSFLWCKCQGLGPDVGPKSVTQGKAPYLWDPSRLLVAVLGEEFWWDYVSLSPTCLDVTLLSFIVAGLVSYVAVYLMCLWEEGSEGSSMPPSWDAHFYTCPFIW